MKIEGMSIAELNAAKYNPRVKLEKGMPEYEKLKSSIQEFGFVDPPIFNIQTKNLVGGHQRVQVAKDLGFTEINVSIVDMPLEKEKQLNIALNKISGHWDETKLTELLESFDSAQLELSGFSDVELTDLIDSMNKPMTLADKVKNNPINSNLFDSFLFPPFSYLDTKSKRWLDRKNLWKSIGIKSELGRDDNLVFNDNLKAPGLEGTSIFDPVLCELAYRWFTPYKNSNILDPFAGGSVRGITANIIGHKYNGIDLRKEQVEANYKNADEIGLWNINWVCDDSLNMSDHFNDESMDLVFTSPPYFDLEVYSDDKSDISNMDYESFEKIYAAILRNASMKLKENRFAIVVISDVRDNNVPDTKPVQSGYYAEKGNYKALKELPVKSHADFSGDSKQVIKVNQNFEIVAVVETKNGTAHGEVAGGGFVTLHKKSIKKGTILSHCSGFHIGREQFLHVYNYKEIKNIVKLV